MSNRHGPEELHVFKEFAKHCELPLQPHLAQKLSPPAPDIRCPLTGGNAIDFELVDGTSPKTKQLLKQRFKIDPLIQDAFCEAEKNGDVVAMKYWSGLSVLIDHEED